jgi:hypothetical protein
VSGRYQVVIPSDAPIWAQQLQASFNSVFQRIYLDMRPPFLTVATLPTDGSIRLAIVTDEAGGEVLAFLDSAGAWRRVTDRNVVS